MSSDEGEYEDEEYYQEPEPDGDVDAEVGVDGDVEDEDAMLGLDEDAAGSDVDDEDSHEDTAIPKSDKHTSTSGPSQSNKDPKESVSHATIRIVPDDERITDNRLHKNEAAFVIATRAEQISKYATCFADTSELHDPVAKAFKELYDRKCPLIIRRAVGVGPAGESIVEEWPVREMTLPMLTPPVPLGPSKPKI